MPANPPFTQQEWLDHAAALSALGYEIFDPHFNTADFTQGPATGMQGPDPAMDSKLYSTIAPVAQALDNRTPATGFKYTLNVTNALQLRPKKWYIHGLMEYDGSSLFPANQELAYMPWGRGGVYNGVNSFGYSIGLATCAAICHAYAAACRMSSEANYPPPDAGQFVVRTST
jgi:hypothetical protein